MKKAISFIILFLLCQDLFAESNFPEFKQLKRESCLYSYSFAASETISKYDPIYLKINKKSEFFYSSRGNSLLVLDVNAYVKTKTKDKYFYLNNQELQLIAGIGEPFSFKIFIYNLHETNKLSIHIDKMRKVGHKNWQGSFSDLNIFLKVENRKIYTFEKKWFVDNSKYAFAINLRQKFKNKIPSSFDSKSIFNLDIDPKVIFHPKIKLFSNNEGIKKDAFDEIDEEIQVIVFGEKCDQTNGVDMKYMDSLHAFIGELHCPFSCSSFTVNVNSEIFDAVTHTYEMENDKPVEIEMKIKKPVLCVIIHPSEQFKKGPISVKPQNFIHFKRQFYDTINYLDSTRPWNNQWGAAYFFVKNYGKEFELLINTEISAIRWELENVRNEVLGKIILGYGKESVPYDEIINSATDFIKGFSISEKLNYKGIIIIVAANPAIPFKLDLVDALQDLLQKNKMGVIIAQFGMGNNDFVDHTKNKEKYKNLLFMEYNLEKEFSNWFFSQSFKRIRKELWHFMDKNGFTLEYLKE